MPHAVSTPQIDAQVETDVPFASHTAWQARLPHSVSLPQIDEHVDTDVMFDAHSP